MAYPERLDFEHINEFVFDPDVEFEELQALCLALAIEIERRAKQMGAPSPKNKKGDRIMSDIPIITEQKEVKESARALAAKFLAQIDKEETANVVQAACRIVRLAMVLNAKAGDINQYDMDYANKRGV